MKTVHHSTLRSKLKVLGGVLAAAALTFTSSAQYVSTLISGLNEPWGVAVGTNGALYLTDAGNSQIIEYLISAGTTNLFVTNQLSSPRGIVAARGGLVVVDQFNQLIRFVSYHGAVSTLAGSYQNPGNQDANGAAAQFSYPVGIAADASGNLYVADWGNGSIRKIDVNNNVSTLTFSGYQFNGPKAVAVDSSGNLWVADTVSRTGGSNVVCLVSNGVATAIAGAGLAGATFSAPSGLLWDANNNRLLISDSGDSVITTLTDSTNGYVSASLAGIYGDAGFVSGSLSVATFDYPVGLAVDTFDSGFYIADYGNNAVRVLQPSAPQPPISTPVLGYVTFPNTSTPPGTSVFNPSSGATFETSVPVAVTAEQGTQTFFTYGPTGSVIPMPTTNSAEAVVYPGDGISPPMASLISPGLGTNDITIYALSEATGRQPSAITNARFIYITANPQIIGSDPAQIQLADSTPGATIYYTIDGSIPTNDGTSAGVNSGTILTLDVSSNVLLNVRAFAPGFGASAVVTEELLFSNFIGNQISFGFQGGVASSKFIASGTNFYAPVTLSLLGAPDIYTLQFDLSVSNSAGANIMPFNPLFQTCLMHRPEGTPPVYTPLPPGIDVLTGVVPGTNVTSEVLEVSWITALGNTNLYDTTKQNLTEFSIGADLLFLDSSEQVVVGGFSFAIPTNAVTGSTYTITLTRPSASSFNNSVVPIPVIIQTPTNGSLTGGAINSIKTVTVQPTPYLVGDVYPLNWYNAGDFGDGSLLDDDVIDTYDAAIDLQNIPPAGTAYFDAMDSCNGTVNNLFDGTDFNINYIGAGDGQINIDDVYVTLQRSLNSQLSNCVRMWSNGQLLVTFTNNVFKSNAQRALTAAPNKLVQSGPQYLTVAAGQVQTGGGLTAQVPVQIIGSNSLPTRVLLFNLEVDPLDGSPPITNAITFTPSVAIASAANTLSSSSAPNEYAAAWLDSTVSGVTGTNIIGTLSITLPPNVNAQSAYKVHFNKFSASPNGIADFSSTAQDGLITLSDRTGSSWKDGIPDTWRLLYFDSVSNLLSAANADPDGDGASNWQEFIAGTNPMDGTSVFRLMPATAPVGGYFVLQWPSVLNKTYAVQCSSSMNGGWVTLATLTGTGQLMQWTDTSAAGAGKFYRAVVH